MNPPDWLGEIEDLHAFFCAWIGGELPAEEAAFARCPASMASDFVIIGPDGELSEREPLLARLRAAHGSRPGLRIWIAGPALRRRQPPFTLVTYEEWQEHAGRTTARRSSALFEDDPGAPFGLRWLHLQETWLPADLANRQAAGS